MKKITLNEEILNQIRLINFDRSKTLLETENSVVGVKNSINSGVYNVNIKGIIQGISEKGKLEKAESATWSIFLNDVDLDAGADFEEVREHLFYGYKPLDSGRPNVDGYYDINTKLKSGKYALIFRGYESNSPVTYYFDVNSNIEKTLDVYLKSTDTNLNTVNLFTNPQIINLCNEIDDIEKKYNDLRKRNSTIKKDSTLRFQNPRSTTFAEGTKITYDLCKPFLDEAKKEFDILKKLIERGEYYLKEANAFMENDIPSNVLPLDLVKEYGTIEGYNAMKGLLSDYSKKRGGENLWREWNDKDGKYIDPNRVVLSVEEREKLEKEWGKLFDNLREVYHIAAPWVAMVLWFIPHPLAKAAAFTIESIDAAFYITEGNYYMAGLCAAFTVLGVWSESWGSLAYSGYYKAAQKEWWTITKAERVAMRRAASRSSLTTTTEFVKKSVKYLAKRIISMFGKTGETAIKFINKLLKMKDILPNFINGFIRFISTMLVQVGTTVWTWDKLASYLGLCNTSDFADAYDKWSNDDHWVVTNITLKPLTGWMGFWQKSTNSCEKERAEISSKEYMDGLKNEEIQTLINAGKFPATMTSEDKKKVNDFYKNIEDQDRKNRENLKQAEQKLIKKVNEYESVIIEELKTLNYDQLQNFIDGLESE